MSEKINYSFTPIPNYFRDHGWFKKPNCVAFVTWAFSRCSTVQRKVFHDHKEITLDPFEFISGRTTCSEETGLTDHQIRVQQNHLLLAGLLEKTSSKTTNKFTVYKWLTIRFSEDINQQNVQQTSSRRPADVHNPDTKIQRSKEVKEPIPTLSVWDRSDLDLVPLKKELEKDKIFSCLIPIRIEEKDKIRLTKGYEEQDIQRGVEALINTKNPRDPIAVIVGVAKKKELNNVEINRAWVQKEVLDDNPGITFIKFSGNFVYDTGTKKDLPLTLIHEMFKETFMNIFFREVEA